MEETWERTPEVLFLCFIVDSPTRGGDVGAYTGSAVFIFLLLTALRVEETWERTPEVLFLYFVVDRPTSGGDVGAYTGRAVFIFCC